MLINPWVLVLPFLLVVITARVASSIRIARVSAVVRRVPIGRGVTAAVASALTLLTALVGEAFVLQETSSLLEEFASGGVILDVVVVIAAVAAAGLVAPAFGEVSLMLDKSGCMGIWGVTGATCGAREWMRHIIVA